MMEGKIEGDEPTLNQLEAVAGSWPLERLNIPLKRFIQYLDRLMAGCC